jgi:hypothetical protein
MLSKRTVFGMLTLSVLLTAPCQGAENVVQKEIVWSQSDGLRYEIYHSSGKGDDWQAPQKLTNNNANNLHPDFVIAPNGTHWIFWSAVQPDGIAIEYLVGEDGNKWSSEPIKLATDHSSAITPSALAAHDGVIWLVWAGNDGEQDEIYYSRFANSAWQKPMLINAANETPDIKPKIALNEQGSIEVRWQGFRDEKYTTLVSTYTTNGWSPEREAEEKEETVENTKPVLPDFLPQASTYVLQEISADGRAKKVE